MTLHSVNHPNHPGDDSGEHDVSPMFSMTVPVPQQSIPEGELPPDVAFQIVSDELMLDGNARMNLATFVTTWMSPWADKLLGLTAAKNMIDKDEYPQTAEIEKRCVSIIAKLWNAPGETIGTSTIGSSEACMLAGLAFKRRWQHARRAAGKTAAQPNIVFSSTVQVVWEKFCNYWEVEPRYVPVTADELNLTPEKMLQYVDENTIGVVAILGVTYTGSYEPVRELALALDDLQQRTGLDIPLHVDAASGGMVAPFLQPDLVWDFRLTRVHSINTSGHKYGLVYPGLGWVVWRSQEYLPEDLIFHVTYLGGDMPTLALNFSRPGAQVVLQYFLILRLGFDGYRRVHQTCRETAQFIANAVAGIDDFELLSKAEDIPVFAWRLKPGRSRNWTLSDLSQTMRFYGWQVPAYPMPADLSDEWVMRVVVRAGVSRDLAGSLVADLQRAVAYLDSLRYPLQHIEPGEHYSH